ncbi:MAG: hypothetical protein JO264_00235 [Acidisphaera sp.]|nr:hypothetical protein [Acidisphaera sp.]
MSRAGLASVPHFVAAHEFVRPLSLAAALYLAGAFAVAACCFFTHLPTAVHGTGLPGIIVAALLLATAGLATCLTLTWARRRDARVDQTLASPTAGGAMVPWIAGRAQGALILLFTGAASLALCWFWPQRAGTAAGGGFVLPVVLLVAAFPCLFLERLFASVAPERLPETGLLQPLLLLPVGSLVAEAALTAVTEAGAAWIYLPRLALSVILLGVAAELAVRAVALWFLPLPQPVAARASIGSVLAGLLHPGGARRLLSPASVAHTIRTQLGLDFSRSWALAYMRAAAAPVLLLMLLFCWFLSGVTRIGLDERGPYERLGVPVAVLKPGLHLLLPWPFGAVRHVELGVVHAVPISFGEANAVAVAPDRSTAEAEPPPSANRLWDAALPSDVAYIIASASAGRQSFETVSVSLRVLYRVGLTDGDARDAAYQVASPEMLLRAACGQLLARFFASETLPGVLGQNRAGIASDLRAQLQRALGRLHSGLEIMSVVIEDMHPPSGAAAAYRSVQAAEIVANTQIATERGRAETTSNIARRDARTHLDDAAAAAAETDSAARIDLTDMQADLLAYRDGSRPFLMERYFSNVTTALAGAPLEIIDHRLDGANLPALDLRPPLGRDVPEEGDRAQ